MEEDLSEPAPHLSEFPDNTGGLELAVIRTMSHTDEGVSLEDFSTQLSHRVETDLLLGSVFEVLG